MDPKTRTVDAALALLAGAQHGVVTRKQVLACGITQQELKRRLERGALIREHRGVFRVGHRAPSTEATYIAAVLACGHGALLSGRAAAHLLSLIKGPAPPPEVVTRTERLIEGVRTRRIRSLEARDGTTCRGIPTTTVPRTLVDLAEVLSITDLARACHEAGVLYRTTPGQVETVLARRPNAKGARNLRRILRGEERVTLSDLEKGFLAVLRKARLPLPQTNRPAGGRRVDCRWPERRLTVELDSYRYHASRHAWENDRRREREAYARGDQFRRYTFGDVLEQPRAMLRELRGLLSDGCPG